MPSFSNSPKKNYTLLVKPKDQPKFMTIQQATSSSEAKKKAEELWPDASILVTESVPIAQNPILGTKDTINRWRRDNRIY